MRLINHHDGAARATNSAFYSNCVAAGKPIATIMINEPNFCCCEWKAT